MAFCLNLLSYIKLSNSLKGSTWINSFRKDWVREHWWRRFSNEWDWREQANFYPPHNLFTLIGQSLVHWGQVFEYVEGTCHCILVYRLTSPRHSRKGILKCRVDNLRSLRARGFVPLFSWCVPFSRCTLGLEFWSAQTAPFVESATRKPLWFVIQIINCNDKKYKKIGKKESEYEKKYVKSQSHDQFKNVEGYRFSIFSSQTRRT